VKRRRQVRIHASDEFEEESMDLMAVGSGYHTIATGLDLKDGGIPEAGSHERCSVSKYHVSN
jgi:hypothetical protein